MNFSQPFLLIFFLICCIQFAAFFRQNLQYSTEIPGRHHPPNWTMKYSNSLALISLDFAAAAFAPDPRGCLDKNGARLVMRTQLPCDPLKNECWAYIAVSPSFIVFSVRGTSTQTQLIIEIIESMTEPKKSFPTGGSVQHYFYESLETIWNAGFGHKLKELKEANPHLPILFTGHSLGGAIASLASTQFAFENNATPGDTLLITFGQPRVGNLPYARTHNQLVPNSFRLVHRFDIVPHLPYCYERLKSPHRCIPLLGHGPFHHGTEIWFPAEDMDAQNSLYVICNGRPFGEDQNCSNVHFVRFQVRDHLFYFGKDVDGYGNSGCHPQQNRQERRRIWVRGRRDKNQQRWRNNSLRGRQ